jgi:DNA-binding transcriptional ArsR family regulator
MTTSKTKLMSIESLELAAECLRVLAHPHRLRMIEMLLQGTFSVGELARACGIPSQMASEHLRLMQRCEMLESSRDGRCVFYRVVDPQLNGILSCIEKRFGVKRTG